MPTPNPEAMDFLLTRRSRPSKTLTAPVPDRATLETLLTAAARSPDHGKLEPWRFIVLSGDALHRMAGEVAATGARLGKDEPTIAKARAAFDDSPLCVAVIEVQKPSEKIPAIEQTYSAGAVCLALLNAALASGWGANWLSGWASHDADFRRDALGLAENETIAGFVHIGTETATPPDRPRPDLGAITTWVDA
ncbi:nitroreductase family protein [Sagittula stellata]|uniref:Putative NAD(P)H nitroreductase n=1 Tax=Sagittula stellata (strain ATCC 700073 / DSM 11524 / E-37) TaxID=388399 RepID=A3KB22_SAGS3|nr:nitroreductase [Sagittula stellata]EBA05607.1 nitroreductase family protein [Sagittula stellata E-37]